MVKEWSRKPATLQQTPMRLGNLHDWSLQNPYTGPQSPLVTRCRKYFFETQKINQLSCLSREIKPNLDCNYTSRLDSAPNENPLGAKSHEKVQLIIHIILIYIVNIIWLDSARHKILFLCMKPNFPINSLQRNLSISFLSVV